MQTPKKLVTKKSDSQEVELAKLILQYCFRKEDKGAVDLLALHIAPKAEAILAKNGITI